MGPGRAPLALVTPSHRGEKKNDGEKQHTHTPLHCAIIVTAENKKQPNSPARKLESCKTYIYTAIVYFLLLF